MKPLRIILSLLIISVTIIVTYELAKGLNFDFLDYLDKKYHFLFLTLLTQIFGVYFSSKRWKHCVESYNEGKKILFSFHTYFFCMLHVKKKSYKEKLDQIKNHISYS